MNVKISSSTSLEIRKRRPGALRQHSIQNSFLDSPPEGEKDGEYVRQKSLRKSYHLRKKGISRYFPNKKVRRSVDEADAFSWLAKPVRPSFYNRTESELLFDSDHLGPQKVQLDTQLSELEAIAIITVLEHIEVMIGILKPGDPDDLDDLNILYYTTPTESMKIMKIVNMAINELAWFGSYSVFRTAVLIPHIIKADEKQLIVDMQENLVHIGNLRNQIRGYSRERKVKKSQITTEREKVQGFFKKQKFFHKRDIRYLELWNKSREDQHTYSLNRIESTLKKKRDELEKKVKLTIYANNNAMLFLRMSIRDLREKSRYFERRRTSDGESLENSITEMRADLDDLQYTTLKARLLDDEGCSRAGANADAFTCREEQCWEAARRMQASMDWRADPCRDFYAYACGGWARDASAWPPAAAAAAAAASLATLQRLVDLQLQNQLSLASTISPYQKLGAFYTSCLRVKERGPSYAPMLALLDELGGYLPPGAPPPDLTALVARLLQVNGAPLFDVDLDADPRNRSRLAIFLDLPRRSAAAGPLWQRPTGPLGLRRWFDGPPPAEPDAPAHAHAAAPAPAPDAARGRRRRAHPKESRAYAYMKSSAEEKRLLSLERLLRVFLPPALAKPTRAKEVQAILLFASMLAKQFPREKELQNRAAQREASELFNLSRLQDEYAFVQWQPLLEEVFSRNFTEDDVFYVRAPDYMRRLHAMLLHFQRRVVHNALLLLFARDSLWELVDATALAGDAGAGLGEGGAGGGGAGDGGGGVGVGVGAGVGGAGGRYWPGFCARVTVSLFARAASALYLRQFAPHEIDALREQVTVLFERLKQTLEARVQRSAWLDEATRAAALHKLRRLRGHFLTWPHLWNASYVEALLHDVHVDPENFFNNVISRYRQMRKIPPDILENPVSEKKWAYPFVVNAFYVRSINSMVIPLAVLTQPTFRADVPRYVPHATVGLLLAHEMVHAFDLAGIAHGADGAPADWFSAPARLRLEARLDCVARQYAAAFTRQVAFLGSSVDVQFDWNATSNENMADIAALQVAHSAWRAALAATPDGPDARLPHINLSTRQLFFVAAAQSYCSSLTPEEYIVLVEVDHHTPYPERINGMMMNSPAFAEAFKCPVGSPMNPEKKCAIW